MSLPKSSQFRSYAVRTHASRLYGYVGSSLAAHSAISSHPPRVRMVGIGGSGNRNCDCHSGAKPSNGSSSLDDLIINAAATIHRTANTIQARKKSLFQRMLISSPLPQSCLVDAVSDNAKHDQNVGSRSRALLVTGPNLVRFRVVGQTTDIGTKVPFNCLKLFDCPKKRSAFFAPSTCNYPSARSSNLLL